MGILQLPILVLIGIENRTLYNSLTASKKIDRKYQEITDLKFVRKKMIHDIFNIKHNKYKIIILSQWKIPHNVTFFVPSHKNYNEININHSLSHFLLQNENNQ